MLDRVSPVMTPSGWISSPPFLHPNFSAHCLELHPFRLHKAMFSCTLPESYSCGGTFCLVKYWPPSRTGTSVTRSDQFPLFRMWPIYITLTFVISLELETNPNAQNEKHNNHFSGHCHHTLIVSLFWNDFDNLCNFIHLQKWLKIKYLWWLFQHVKITILLL